MPQQALRPPPVHKEPRRDHGISNTPLGFGEDSHLARATSKQVLMIRKLYAKGNVTQSSLAERFGISTSDCKEHPGPTFLEAHLAMLQYLGKYRPQMGLARELDISESFLDKLAEEVRKDPPK
jgi:ribosomal protein S19E (S16A)